MAEHSKPKRVCRRNALALFGYAAAIRSRGLACDFDGVALLKPKPAPHPPRPPLRRRSLVRNGVRNDALGALNDVRNGARGAQNDVRNDAQDAKSDVTRVTVPPNRKSNPLPVKQH